MKIHHLSCGTLRAHKLKKGIALCHCLLIETGGGLVLVDSGVGTEDMRKPARLGLMHFLLNIRRSMDETALYRIQALGFSEKDVKHIILTHLDLDHTGGIPDFPWAKIHVFKPEYEAAMRPLTFREGHRYRKEHLGGVRNWAVYDRVSSEPWYGFDCIRGLEGLPDDIVMVPLIGHSRGHCAVAVHDGGKWTVHAGDAYYHHLQMAPTPDCPLYLRLFQHMAHLDYVQAMQTKDRLWAFANKHRDEAGVFCAHDPSEL